MRFYFCCQIFSFYNVVQSIYTRFRSFSAVYLGYVFNNFLCVCHLVVRNQPSETLRQNTRMRQTELTFLIFFYDVCIMAKLQLYCNNCYPKIVTKIFLHFVNIDLTQVHTIFLKEMAR